MKLYRSFFILPFYLFIIAIPQANAEISHGQSADLFYDRNWVYDRPWTRSDEIRGHDMFKPVPLMFHRNADLFDSARQLSNNYGQEDVLPHVPLTLQRPTTTLQTDPREGPYLAR